MSLHTTDETSLHQSIGAAALLVVALCLSLMGCQKRERVLDIETPGADITIDKTEDLDGSRGIDINVND